jgi:hypothetical protein
VVVSPPISMSTVAVVAPPNAAKVCSPGVVSAGIVTDVVNAPSPSDTAPPSTTGSLYNTRSTSPPPTNPVPVTVTASPAFGDVSDTDIDAPALVPGGVAGGVNAAGTVGDSPADVDGADGADVDEPAATVVVVTQSAGDASTRSATTKPPAATSTTSTNGRPRRVNPNTAAPATTDINPTAITAAPAPVTGNTHSFTIDATSLTVRASSRRARLHSPPSASGVTSTETSVTVADI